jgi:hypothetical protein
VRFTPTEMAPNVADVEMVVIETISPGRDMTGRAKKASIGLYGCYHRRVTDLPGASGYRVVQTGLGLAAVTSSACRVLRPTAQAGTGNSDITTHRRGN